MGINPLHRTVGVSWNVTSYITVKYNQRSIFKRDCHGNCDLNVPDFYDDFAEDDEELYLTFNNNDVDYATNGYILNGYKNLRVEMKMKNYDEYFIAIPQTVHDLEIQLHLDLY